MLYISALSNICLTIKLAMIRNFGADLYSEEAMDFLYENMRLARYFCF